jgi:uncharacterized protein
MSNANVSLVQSLYAAFGKGEVGTIVAACTPDVAWHSGGRESDFPAFGPRRGQQAVTEFFKIVAENEDFQEFSPRAFYPADDKVFVLGTYAMTMRKTGKKCSSDWCHVFTIKGGKLAGFREFTDTAQAAEAFRG